MRDYLSESSLDQASVVKHLIKLESNSFDPQNKYEESVRDALYAYAFENVNGELTGLMETIQSNLNNFTRIINDSYSSSLKEYSQTMANACGALTTIFDNVQETQNDIMDGIEYIKRGRK